MAAREVQSVPAGTVCEIWLAEIVDPAISEEVVQDALASCNITNSISARVEFVRNFVASRQTLHRDTVLGCHVVKRQPCSTQLTNRRLWANRSR